MQTTEITRYDKTKLTKAERWQVADRLAADRLPDINPGTVPVIPSRSLYCRVIKRLLDIALSFVALLLTLPVNILLAVATLCDVGQPIFFAHKRVGRDGRVFTLYKFRNMTNQTDAAGELLPPAERVTRWGRFVRKTSLDELLNFWSILRGDMSFIGPRPLPVEYTGRYHDRHRQRLAVRPGLECPPFRPTGRVSTWQEQFENDVWYVEHLSFKTDCILALRLVQLVFDRKNTAERMTVKKRGPFMGYDENGLAIDLEGVPQEYVTSVLSEGKQDGVRQ